MIHNLLNRWNHRDCQGSDLDQENCGAGIRIGKYKLLVGYPGDGRWSNVSSKRTPRGPQMPWDYQRFGKAAWKETRRDGCNLATGIGCPCWRGRCLYDLEADPGERVDLSMRLPDVARRLMRRLVEASASGTQAAHLCHAAADADRKAFTATITQREGLSAVCGDERLERRPERARMLQCLRMAGVKGGGRTEVVRAARARCRERRPAVSR